MIEAAVRGFPRGAVGNAPPVSLVEQARRGMIYGVVGTVPAFEACPSHVWIGVALLLQACACILAPVDRFAPAQLRCLYLVLAVFAVFGIVGMLQVLPAPAWIANPIWKEVAVLVDPTVVPRISARAEIPTMAITRLLLLATSFVAGFSLGASRRSSMRLLVVYAWLIAGYACYGLIAELVDPTRNLWGTKVAYVGSVTGPFVGRSTAAAYFGVGTIIWTVLLTRLIQGFHLPNYRYILFVSLTGGETARLMAYLLAFLACFAATLGTKSRAALLLTFAGAVLSIACIYAHGAGRRRTVVLGAAALVCGLAILVGGFGTGRISAEGLFDPYRWSAYKSEIAAIRTYPWMGTGWGTFAAAFPTFRLDDVSIWGIWERAHSTPLEIAFEMGVPCAIVVVCASVYLAFKVLSAALRATGERRFLLGAVAGAALLVLLQTSIDFVMQISTLVVVFGVFFGAGVSRATSLSTPPQLLFGISTPVPGSNPVDVL